MKTHHYMLIEESLSLRPKGFNATMELQAQITNTEKVEEWSHKKELWVFPVPDLGFAIQHLGEIGLTLAYQIGYSTKVSGSATVVFGATSSLPDDAVISINLKDHEKSSHRGLDGYVLQPILDVKAITGTVKFAVFTQADIRFGIDLEKIGRSDVELNLKIPQLSKTISAGYSKHLPSPFLKREFITSFFVHIEKGGFCSQEDGASDTGAKSTMALSIELWFEVFFGKKKDSNVYSRKLWGVTDTLDEKCVPVQDIKKIIDTPPEMAASSLLPLPSLASIGL